MLVGPGEKVEKGQVVHPFIKDQQSKRMILIIKATMVKGVGAGAPQPTNPRSQQKNKKKNNKQSYHVNR